jgi:hypothetical protein
MNLKAGLTIMILFLGIQFCRTQDYFTGLVHPKYYFTSAQIDSLYRNLEPSDIKPSYKLFYGGMAGYKKMIVEDKLQNNRYITLIDFSLSSKKKRLWVIDIDSLKIVHHSLVSHGRNSGEEYAVRFSNAPNSYMSSIGFYITGNSYCGKHGESLYLEGMEAGVNDNARKRAIVMHSADYATRDFVNKYGRLGRSYGCPALPPAKSTMIIDTIKNKSCLFIYYPDVNYLVNSKYLN